MTLRKCITAEMTAQIIEALSNPDEPQHAVAKRFNVSTSVISGIAYRARENPRPRAANEPPAPVPAGLLSQEAADESAAEDGSTTLLKRQYATGQHWMTDTLFLRLAA